MAVASRFCECCSTKIIRKVATVPAGVNHQLPGVAVVEKRPRNRPCQSRETREDKGDRMAEGPGTPSGKRVNSLLIGSPTGIAQTGSSGQGSGAT
jgi:hypothetical protein